MCGCGVIFTPLLHLLVVFGVKDLVVTGLVGGLWWYSGGIAVMFVRLIREWGWGKRRQLLRHKVCG